MMITKVIKINTIREVNDFVRTCTANPDGLDFYASRGRTNVPCTSLMSIFALDPSLPFTVTYPNTKNTIDFTVYLSQFEVNE